jgi:hypothetical protein
MRGGGLRIAHVMQAVEAGDEVEVFLRKVLRPANLETHIRNVVSLGMGACGRDGAGMEVIAGELRLRERLRHQDG